MILRGINIAIFIALLLFLGSGVNAGPTAIRDDRVTDTAVTPALGRGYSIATSTYQSLCMGNVVTTKPSYNFKYTFEEMNEDGSKTSDVKTQGAGSFSRSFFGFSVSGKMSYSSSEKSTEKWTSHRILVTMTVDVYYASIDEGQTRLTESARTLLTRDDIPGFFDSCGPYYIRSIGRFAKFVSMFTYMSKSTERDKSYEAALELTLKGWGASGSFSGSMSSQVKETLNKYNLKIDTAAWGLGKDSEAVLISHDLESFKAAIKAAFISMMDERTGLVTSIEVVPWVENTEFQVYMRLQEEEVDGQKVPQYLQKRTLSSNAEFLAEMDRAARNRLNIYYKAKLCRLRIDQDYADVPDGTGGGTSGTPTLTAQYKDKLMVNNKSGQNGDFSLNTFYTTQLADARIKKYLEDYETFVYGRPLTTGGGGGGGGDDKSKKAVDTTPSVSTCVRDLRKEKSMRLKSYRQVATCAGLESQFAAIVGQKVDNFCMPQLAGTNEGDDKNRPN